MVSKYTPSGKYVELGEYPLFETNGIEHSDGGIIFQRTLICMKRWEENNPTPEQAKSERDGKTTKICLEVWNIHKDYGKEIGANKIDHFQMNIGSFKTVMKNLKLACATLLSKGKRVLEENKELWMKSQNLDDAVWYQLQQKFTQRLEDMGWKSGCAIPTTDEHMKAIREAEGNPNFVYPSWKHTLCSFNNQTKGGAKTEDSMIVSLQRYSTREQKPFYDRFFKALKKADEIGVIYPFAGTHQIAAVFSRITSGLETAGETVHLICPALFKLIEYYNLEKNLFTQKCPTLFCDPRIEATICAEEFQNNVKQEDGSLETSLLRSLQTRNLSYLGNPKYLVPTEATGNLALENKKVNPAILPASKPNKKKEIHSNS